MMVGGRQEHLSEHFHCHSLYRYVSSFFCCLVMLFGDADTAVLLLEEMPTTADIVKNIRVMQITAAATTIVVFLPFVGFLVLLGVVAAGCLLATSSPCSTSPASSTCCDALLVIVLSALE